jgi:hypothetical protein
MKTSHTPAMGGAFLRAGQVAMLYLSKLVGAKLMDLFWQPLENLNHEIKVFLFKEFMDGFSAIMKL